MEGASSNGCDLENIVLKKNTIGRTLETLKYLQRLILPPPE